MYLVKEKSALPRLLVIPFSVLALISAVLLKRWPQLVLEAAYCPLRDMTGLPCPTCGGTQAAVALSHGFWVRAFLANPLVSLAAVLLGTWTIYALLATLIPAWRYSLLMSPKDKRAARILAALMVAGTWIWEIIRR